MQVFKDLLELVPNLFPQVQSEPKAPEFPHLLVAISGPRKPAKQDLANCVLCAWQT